MLWAYATRRADSIEAAGVILVNAVEQFPNVAVVHYNLRSITKPGCPNLSEESPARERL